MSTEFQLSHPEISLPSEHSEESSPNSSKITLVNKASDIILKAKERKNERLEQVKIQFEQEKSKRTPKPKPVIIPEAETIVNCLKEVSKQKEEFRKAVEKLKEEFNLKSLAEEEELLRNKLYNIMVQNNILHYKSYKQSSCLPKEIQNDLNLEKKIKNLKNKISEACPSLDEDTTETIAIELS